MESMDVEIGLEPPQSELEGIRKRHGTLHNTELSGDTKSKNSEPEPGVPSSRRGVRRQPFTSILVKGKKALFVKSRSPSADIETGEEGVRECLVEEVTDDHEAMNPRGRLLRRLFRFIKSKKENRHDQDINTARPKQYRLCASRNKPYGTLFQRMSGVGSENDGVEGQWSSHASLAAYLHWTLRTSYSLLLMSSAVIFWGLTVVWAIFIHLIGRAEPNCIVVSGGTYDVSGSFIDAYALSWTTFATVGYGAIYPQMSTHEGHKCAAINIVASLEAFFGILFAGFMAAIVFGKIARAQRFATATFSDPIVVRYGTGVVDQSDDADSESSESKKDGTPDATPPKQMPWPILEFRLANRMHGVAGGEIMNANIHCVASTLVSNAWESVRSTVKRTSKANPSTLKESRHFLPRPGKLLKKSRMSKDTSGSNVQPVIREDESFDPDDVQQSTRHVSIGTKMAQVMEDETSGGLIPRRAFTSLHIDTPSHPFFKRVWNVRHTLDADSPLLSSTAKRRIMENNGVWPGEWNTYKHVRECIHFHQIIVNVSGTANATGCTVYAQKVYEFCDINIGYSFANMLCHDSDGKLSVDLELVNDVMEQNGGGGEPFINVQEDDTFGVNAAVEATGAIFEVAGQAAMEVTRGAAVASGAAVDIAGQAATHTVGGTLAVTEKLGNAAGSRILLQHLSFMVNVEADSRSGCSSARA